jgi:hypothetical protein
MAVLQRTDARSSTWRPALSRWRKSSFSGAVDCVEVCHHLGRVMVRDSKDPSGNRLALTPSEWGTFLDGVRAGGLD